MLFTTLDFFLFLPIVVVIYFLTPVKLRWIWLLVSSYFFYMYWNPWYIGLILGSSLVDYTSAIQINKTSNKKNKKWWLWFSVIVNLGILFTFKYFNFFTDQVGELIQVFRPEYQPILLNVLLPVGISFYTFQSMSYTIDVYKGYAKVEKHPGKFFLYVAFFPQLVAGPIERAKDLLPQFHFNYQFEYRRVVNGLQLIIWGLFKKLVIADKLGLYVNEIYNNPTDYGGLTIYVASVMFLFQLFCDFSAYTDMAVGSAKILGIRLSKNFDNRVYWITSFLKFWKGWHITLTNWFRDYVFFPISGLRKGLVWIFIAVLITSIFNGIWHGAEWTFFIWGALNGIAVVAETQIAPRAKVFFDNLKIAYSSQLRWLSGFLVSFNLAIFSIIFFRAANISDALILTQNLFLFSSEQIAITLFDIIPFYDLMLITILVIAMDLFHIKIGDRNLNDYLDRQNFRLRWAFYILMLLCIFYLGEPPRTDFIYFEF